MRFQLIKGFNIWFLQKQLINSTVTLVCFRSKLENQRIKFNDYAMLQSGRKLLHLTSGAWIRNVVQCVLEGKNISLWWLVNNKTGYYNTLWRCKSLWDPEVMGRAQHSWEPWWQSVGLHPVTFAWSVSQSVTCDTASHLSNYDRCLLTHIQVHMLTQINAAVVDREIDLINLKNKKYLQWQVFLCIFAS